VKEETTVKYNADLATLKQIPSTAEYVIVGGGAAGVSAIKAIKEQDPSASVLVVGDENPQDATNRPYFSKLNVHLSKHGDGADGLSLSNTTFYEGRVAKIEEQQAEKTVKITLEDGRFIVGTKGVLLATGVQPDLQALPLIPDTVRSRCLTLRSANDYQHLQETLKSAKKVVICGGGYVACELASAIKTTTTDKSVTILNPEKRLLASIFPEYMSRHIQKQLKSFGVQYKEYEILKISANSTGIRLVSTEGKEVDCDLLIFDPPSVPSPQPEFTINAANVDISKGVPCDKHLRIGSMIFAAGDVANVADTGRIGHYGNAVYSGRIAGTNMTRPKVMLEYDANATTFSGNVAGISMTGVGRVDNNLSTVGLWESAKKEEGEEEYRRGAIVYHDEKETVRGVLLVNLPEDKEAVARSILGTTLPPQLSLLSTKLLAKSSEK
jgi:NADPH-dependent 2,4-dienoyl-CoA reductase/sulfur reductase-like enzyme